MKLMFVGYMHGYGGAEKMLITLANTMSERNHEIVFVSLAANNIVYNMSSKIKYLFIPDNGKGKINILLNRYNELKKIIESYKPELIIHFWLQSAYMCAFMKKKIAMQTIYCERGDPSDKEYKGILGIIRKIALRRIKALVFQSKGARDYFNNNIRKKSCIIHNPVFINPTEWKIPDVREKKIVTVGRLHEQKNQKLFIDAIALLPLDKQNYTVEIYGDGELKESLQNQINKLKLSDRVHLMGTYPNIYEKIHNASVFVLSSDYEGLPNALLEAMALGIPCISTDCKPGGAKELIENGRNGIIVERDNAKSLAEKINYLLDNPHIAMSYGIEAQKIVANENPQKIYDKWEDFFWKQINSAKVI